MIYNIWYHISILVSLCHYHVCWWPDAMMIFNIDPGYLDSCAFSTWTGARSSFLVDDDLQRNSIGLTFYWFALWTMTDTISVSHCQQSKSTVTPINSGRLTREDGSRDMYLHNKELEIELGKFRNMVNIIVNANTREDQSKIIQTSKCDTMHWIRLSMSSEKSTLPPPQTLK